MRNKIAAFAAVLALSCPALATLTTTTNSASYTGNGSTTAFTVPFKFLQNSDLVVTVAGVTKALGSDYSVKGAGAATGTVTFTVAPASGAAVVITRAVPLTQTTSLRQSRSFDPATIENALDRSTMQIQQGVQNNAAASLSSLTLTTPLPVASGGTGGSPPNCGAGVLTSDGTTFSCVTLSGLAPPGTTGVALQSASPGSFQTGNANLAGNLVLRAVSGGGAADPPAKIWTSAPFGPPSTIGGFLYLGGNSGGGFGPLGTDPGGLALYPRYYNDAGVSARTGGDVFQIFGAGNNLPILRFQWQVGAPNTTVGYSSLVFSGCTNNQTGILPCISTASANGMATALYLQGKPADNTGLNKVVTTTGSTNVTVGNLFESQNAGVAKFQVGFNGSVTTAGPLTIGGGTPISSSYRAVSVSIGLPSVAANTCTGLSPLALTVATVGAECVAATGAHQAGLIPYCGVATANTCTISVCNVTGGTVTPPFTTYSCRVFNP